MARQHVAHITCTVNTNMAARYTIFRHTVVCETPIHSCEILLHKSFWYMLNALDGWHPNVNSCHGNNNVLSILSATGIVHSKEFALSDGVHRSLLILIYSIVHAQKSVAWLQEKQTKNGDFVIQCVISCKIAEFRKWYLGLRICFMHMVRRPASKVRRCYVSGNADTHSVPENDW